MFINMPLNGYEPEATAEMVDRILTGNKDILIHFTLSIDGIGRIQDRIRGAGQWDRTVATWVKLRKLRSKHRNMRLSAQTTVCKENIQNISEVQTRFSGVSDNHVFAFATSSSYYNDQPGLATEARFGEADLEAIERLASENKFSILSPTSWLLALFVKGQLKRLKFGSSGIPCAASFASITLRANGTLGPCLFKDSDDVGDVRAAGYDIPKMLKTRGAARTRAAARRCDKCWNNCDAITSLVHAPIRAGALLK